jgi:hypothetical protein
MLHREIILYSENRAKHLNTLVVKMDNILVVKQVVHITITVF